MRDRDWRLDWGDNDNKYIRPALLFSSLCCQSRCYWLSNPPLINPLLLAIIWYTPWITFGKFNSRCFIGNSRTYEETAILKVANGLPTATNNTMYSHSHGMRKTKLDNFPIVQLQLNPHHILSGFRCRQVYFARISAFNGLGYGARRTADPMETGATAEGGMQVPYQVRSDKAILLSAIHMFSVGGQSWSWAFSFTSYLLFIYFCIFLVWFGSFCYLCVSFFFCVMFFACCFLFVL